MKLKEAFLTTYRLKGGAFAFWAMILGCVLSFVLPAITKQFSNSIRMLIVMAPATLALIYGQMFTASLGQILTRMSEAEDKGNVRHPKKR